MIPAKYDCPKHWTREYFGYLMSENHNHYRSQFTCVDHSLKSVIGSSHNHDGFIQWKECVDRYLILLAVEIKSSLVYTHTHTHTRTHTHTAHACACTHIHTCFFLLLSILPVRHRKVSQEGKACKVCHPKPKGTY